MSSARKWIQRFVRFLMRQLIDFECHGAQNFPAEGPLIVYFNHINLVDPALAVAVVPREVIPMSKVENMDHPLIGPLARLYGVIPVRRGEADVQAFKRSLEVLRAGKALLIAPEGTRSGHGQLLEAKDGLTRLAVRSEATAIPVALVGQETFRSRLSRLRRTRVYCWVGRPFRFVKAAGARLTHYEWRAMTAEAMAELAALLPPANRGAYGALVAQPRQWIQYETAPVIAGR